jgi:hypothetical protein
MRTEFKNIVWTGFLKKNPKTVALCRLAWYQFNEKIICLFWFGCNGYLILRAFKMSLQLVDKLVSADRSQTPLEPQHPRTMTAVFFLWVSLTNPKN